MTVWGPTLVSGASATNSREACGACGLVDKILIKHDWFNPRLGGGLLGFLCTVCENHLIALTNLLQSRCCICLISRPCHTHDGAHCRNLLSKQLTYDCTQYLSLGQQRPRLYGADRAFAPRLFHCWIRIHFPNTPNSQPFWLSTITCML